MDARTVAAYCIEYSLESSIDITNLKLQKILYYAYLEYYNNYKDINNCIFEENISAWDYGPVVQEVYFDYKKYGNNAIEEVEMFNDVLLDDKGHIVFEIKKPNTESLSKMSKDVIKKVVDTFKDIRAWDLVERSHEESPWKSTYSASLKKNISRDLLYNFAVSDSYRLNN